MSPIPDSPKPSFFKSHVLPLLLVFLIPGFSAWFFTYAEARVEEEVLRQLDAALQESTEIDPENRAAIMAYQTANPPSQVMASNHPDFADLQLLYAETGPTYATFRWMKRTAWICLLTVAATFLLVGASVACSLRSQAAQYYSLRIGWPVLQFSAAIQVLGQAILLVALSYWVTALLTNAYYPKLIVIAAFLALAAVFALWKAIFAKLDPRPEVHGELISEAQAPALWQRVREMAAKMHTPPPDQIIAGIEPSFFVTEHPITLNGQAQTGRSLYVSLPMLKVLQTDEADAVLGHELAHLSGEDTLWSRKIAPITGKFALYMHTLANGVGVVVAHFMHFFWKLYSLSLSRLSRLREFRADAVGATLVSKDAMMRALVKTAAYCDFRAETELAVVKSEQVDRGLNLARKLEEGYPAYLSAFAASDNAAGVSAPHPFDTHPPLHQRLGELGFDARAALADRGLASAPQGSWYHAIEAAPAMEERMWDGRQKTLETVQVQDLAWRLMPKTEEELEIVLEHFPRATFRHKDGTEALLEFDRIYLSSWDGPILFKDIARADAEETLKGQRLTLTTRSDASASKPAKVKLYAAAFGGERGDLLSQFSAYFSRHQQAELWSSS